MNRSRVLADLVPPAGWDAVPAGAVLAPVARTGYPDERLLSVSKYRGVHVREDGDSHSRPSEDLSHYLLTMPGDLVVNIMLAWDRGLGVTAERGLVSPAYATYTVDQERVDSRFLDYQVRSEPAIAEWRRRSYGIQPSRWRLYWERMSSAKLLLPPLDTQRRIADMLDAETARIDTLIAKNERVLGLLKTRVQSILEQRIYGNLEGVMVTPLHYLCDPSRPIRYGIVLPGPDVDDGVPLIKGGDVHSHSLDRGTACRVSFDIESQHQQSRVRVGDLVYAIRGSFGDVEIIPDILDGANMTQDVARIAPRSVDRRWLLYALRAPGTLAQAERSSRGATISGVNIESLRNFRLPVPSRDVQRSVADEMEAEQSGVDQIVRRVDRQQELLRLRRQALITAAVTGQIEV